MHEAVNSAADGGVQLWFLRQAQYTFRQRSNAMPGAQRTVGEVSWRWHFHAWHQCGAPVEVRRFPDRNAAAFWLRRFRSDPFAMAELRRVAAKAAHPGTPLWRASDEQVLESLAALLMQGTLHAHRIAAPATARRTVQAGATSAVPPPAPRPGTPSRSVTASADRISPAPSPKEDADTFPAQTDGAATAAVLRSAAASGVPFCEECAKAAAAKKAA